MSQRGNSCHMGRIWMEMHLSDGGALGRSMIPGCLNLEPLLFCCSLQSRYQRHPSGRVVIYCLLKVPRFMIWTSLLQQSETCLVSPYGCCTLVSKPPNSDVPGHRRTAVPPSGWTSHGTDTFASSSYSCSRMPSFVMTLTNTPLKSMGSLRLSSWVHIRRIFMPCSKSMSGWWCLSRRERQ